MRSSMRKPLRLLLAVTAILAFGASAAQAATISPTGAITATSNGKLTIRSTLLTSMCDWQLIGTIDRSTASPGDQIGSITSTRVANCLGAITITDLIATQGAYRLNLTSVLGSPSVTGALITIANWTHRYNVPTCLFAASIGALLTQPSGGANTLSLLTNSLSGSCGTASLNGSFSISPGQTIT